MHKTFIIAEIAQAHEGSLGIAHSYIDALSDLGVDAIKFQTHIAEAESSFKEPFRIKFSYEDKTRFDYWKRMEFSEKHWTELKNHCEEKGVEFISSPFSCEAVELLERIGVSKYKIGSGEISNYLMLDKIAKTGKPIILSTGMSDYEEISKTIDFLKSYDNELSILQCTTAYPTKPEQWGLTEIPKLKAKFNCKIGYSDHSSNIASSIAAVTLGAEIIEFHAIFDKKMFGPDSKASLTIDEIKNLVKHIRDIEKSLNHKYSKKSDKNLKSIFGKSLCVNKDLKKGHKISLNDLESKKPMNMGINSQEFSHVVGKTLHNSKKKWDFLNQNDINYE